MDALEQLKNLIDSFVDKAEELKDKVYAFDEDEYAREFKNLTDSMRIENEKTIDVLDELNEALFKLNLLSDDINNIIN